jgi:hypothetical protein
MALEELNVSSRLRSKEPVPAPLHTTSSFPRYTKTFTFGT